MKLQGRVPVEPLDDERLTNIERNLVVRVSELRDTPARAPRRMLAFAGMAMAVAVAGFVGWQLRGDGTPVVGKQEPQTFAMKTDAEQRSMLDLGDAQITSAVGTDYKVERSPNRVVLEMANGKRGKLDLHVDHKPGRLLVVKAGDTEIEDVGTRFTVDYDGKGRVDVRVTEGEVKVKRAGLDVPITASNAWTTDIGPITIVALEQREADAAGAVVAINAGGTHVPTNPNVVAVGPSNQGSGGSNAGTGSNGSGAGSNGPKVTKVGGPNAKKAILGVVLVPVDDGTSTPMKDPKSAKAKYLELIKGMQEGEDKAWHLYSIAVMEHLLKQDKAATHTLNGVLKRSASKAHQPALWLDVRIKCLAMFNAQRPDEKYEAQDQCQSAINRYLNKYPDGSPSGAAQQVLREI